jgi:alkylation response protein AidB-like acyl-CoA dehydrogenase
LRVDLVFIGTASVSAWSTCFVTSVPASASNRFPSFLSAFSASLPPTYHAAHAFDSEPDDRIVHGKVAMAKLFASEMAGRVADRALQVLGGRGYRTSHPVERYYRELRVDRIWEGTSEIQRDITARGPLKRGVAAYLP